MKERVAEGKIKPVTVRIEDFKKQLNGAAAQSGLPPFMLEILMREYLMGIHSVAEKEYEQDRAEWEKSVAKQEKNVAEQEKKHG